MTAVTSPKLRELTTYDLQRANIPEKYWTATFKEVPKGAPYREVVARYMTGMDEFLTRGEGLYLWSVKNGTGKTALATLVLRRALRMGKSGYYIRSQAAKVAMQVPERVMFDDGTTVENRMRNVDVLVLDDFAKEHRTASGFTEQAIEDLVRERVQRNKTTIFTANVIPTELGKGLFTVDLVEVMRESVAHVEIVGADGGGKNWRLGKGEDLMDRLYGEKA